MGSWPRLLLLQVTIHVLLRGLVPISHVQLFVVSEKTVSLVQIMNIRLRDSFKRRSVVLLCPGENIRLEVLVVR